MLSALFHLRNQNYQLLLTEPLILFRDQESKIEPSGALLEWRGFIV